MVAPTSPLKVPAITEGLWDTAAVLDWLGSLGVGAGGPLLPGAVGFALPRSPDRIAVVTMDSGGPLEAEGLVDNPTFQLRVRGVQYDPVDAERRARQFDRLILFADLPVTRHGVRIYSVTRSGGGPTAIQPVPTDGIRSEYTCTYITKVSTLAA